MNTKHTPSPWIIKNDYLNAPGKTGLRDFKIKGSDGVSICACAVTVNRSPDEKEANARLIAAAPDLLKACKILMELAGADSLASLELEEEDRATLESVSQIVNSIESKN